MIAIQIRKKLEIKNWVFLANGQYYNFNIQILEINKYFHIFQITFNNTYYIIIINQHCNNITIYA